MSIRSGLGKTPEQYAKFGLKRGKVEQWEDGSRTGGVPGTYEWWYFDARMDDGANLVIVFHTKRMLAPGKPPAPYVTFDLDTADGRHYEEYFELPGVDFSAAKDHCDVHLGDCYITGDLQNYEIRFKNDAADAKVTLRSNVPPWRPETGHIFFGENDEHYFAWLPSVPEGTANAEITVDGKTTQYTGTGYHDHNWGNIVMTKVINHWYWGRAKLGDYRVISSWITAEKKYGYNEFPIFLIAKPGERLADDGMKLTYAETEQFPDPVTGKPVHNKLVYDYRDGDTRFRVTYARETSIASFKMIGQLKGIKRAIAALVGLDAGYHRFTGAVKLERLEDGAPVETIDAPAIWELMYFGHTPKK